MADVCDGDDGRNDGVTYFTRVQSNQSYAALEYYAPSGYQAGKMTYFTKPAGTLLSKRITQVAGGVPVKVTTLKGSTSTEAAGACYRCLPPDPDDLRRGQRGLRFVGWQRGRRHDHPGRSSWYLPPLSKQHPNRLPDACLYHRHHRHHDEISTVRTYPQ